MIEVEIHWMIWTHRYAQFNKDTNWTGAQSDLLKRVTLTVSKTKYNHTKMFGTLVEGPADSGKGEWQDPCAGDAGGPLMYQEPSSNKWVIIGWLEETNLQSWGRCDRRVSFGLNEFLQKET